MDWHRFLTEFDKRILEGLGVGNYSLPRDHNPICDALRCGDFVERFGKVKGFNRTSISRLATICQMVVFDATGGPEGDGKPKALRRHWYSWYKTRFAQPFAKQLGDVKPNAQGIEEMDDRAWSGRLSQTYAAFVDGRQVTYKDLWVEDASRMMHKTWGSLFSGCHIILAVEKDSLFGDFKAAARALGATTVYSGKGKSSKAAIEKVLRDHFGIHPEYEESPFSKRYPLIILHISDHDYDGESVIGPTFAQQARRYTEHVREARVGIRPESVDRDAWTDKWYTVKTSNTGYTRWAEAKGLYLAECSSCGHMWAVQATCSNMEDREYLDLEDPEDWEYYAKDHHCPECECAAYGINPEDDPHGFEVEALRTRDYYSLIVDALLQVLPFEYIVGKLRDECKASARGAAESIQRDILAENESYQSLLEEFERLEEIKSEFENRVLEHLETVGRPHTSDWRDLEDDPEPQDYRDHVVEARDYTDAWRPFSSSKRTQELIEYLQDDESEAIEEFKTEKVWS